MMSRYKISKHVFKSFDINDIFLQICIFTKKDFLKLKITSSLFKANIRSHAYKPWFVHTFKLKCHKTCILEHLSKSCWFTSKSIFLVVDWQEWNKRNKNILFYGTI